MSISHTPLKASAQTTNRNTQAAMFVWLGGPVPDHVLEKIKELKLRGYDVYLMHDPESVPTDKRSAAERNLNVAKESGCKLIDLDRKNFLRGIDDLSQSEKDTLLKAYLYQLYGHDYFVDQDPSYNRLVQNYAAAADIARLVGIEQLKKLVGENITHLMYLDHDVMPNASMDETPQAAYQVHQLRNKASICSNDNPSDSMQGIALNNAVIRVKKDNKLCLDALSLVAERYDNFFKLSEADRAHCLMKSFLETGVRLTFTFFIGGPNIFETLGHQEKYSFLGENLLFDKGGDSNPDFKNDSAETWRTEYRPETNNSDFDPNNQKSMRDLYYLLEYYIAVAFNDKTGTNIEGEYKNILHSLAQTGLSKNDINQFRNNNVFRLTFISASGLEELAKNNPSIVILRLLSNMLTDETKLFKFLNNYYEDVRTLISCSRDDKNALEKFITFVKKICSNFKNQDIDLSEQNELLMSVLIGLMSKARFYNSSVLDILKAFDYAILEKHVYLVENEFGVSVLAPLISHFAEENQGAVSLLKTLLLRIIRDKKNYLDCRSANLFIKLIPQLDQDNALIASKFLFEYCVGNCLKELPFYTCFNLKSVEWLEGIALLCASHPSTVAEGNPELNKHLIDIFCERIGRIESSGQPSNQSEAIRSILMLAKLTPVPHDTAQKLLVMAKKHFGEASSEYKECLAKWPHTLSSNTAGIARGLSPASPAILLLHASPSATADIDTTHAKPTEQATEKPKTATVDKPNEEDQDCPWAMPK